MLRNSAQTEDITIGVGDFNMRPGSLEHSIVRRHGCVVDTWLPLTTLGHIRPMRPLPVYQRPKRIVEQGITCNSNLNSWRAHRPVNAESRLDHVFVNQESVKVKESMVVFTETIESLARSYSDHFGFGARLEIKDNAAQKDKQTAEMSSPLTTSQSKRSPNATSLDRRLKPSTIHHISLYLL